MLQFNDWIFLIWIFFCQKQYWNHSNIKKNSLSKLEHPSFFNSTQEIQWKFNVWCKYEVWRENSTTRIKGKMWILSLTAVFFRNMNSQTWMAFEMPVWSEIGLLNQGLWQVSRSCSIFKSPQIMHLIHPKISSFCHNVGFVLKILDV